MTEMTVSEEWRELMDEMARRLYKAMEGCYDLNEYARFCTDCQETIDWLEAHGWPRPEGWP